MDPVVSRSVRALPPTVVALGVVSLLTDVSSEMIFSLLPAYLAAHVVGAPVVLGAMEGLADLVSAGFKYTSGKWADRASRLRPFVFAGYSLSALTRPLMAFAVSWWEPVLVRMTDRVGKGIRTTPRDALIAHWVPEGARARAFGFHRGMDHAGAALGSAVALLLVGAGLAVERVFLASIVPGLLAVGVLFWTREPNRPERERDQPRRALVPVPRRLWGYLVPVTVFGMANATDAFLLLLLTQQGARPEVLPAAWLLLHIVKSAVSYPAGWLADRLGAFGVVLAGWCLYTASYVLLANSPSVAFTFGTIAFYGLYHALAEGAEKSLLTSLVPAGARGRALGLYHGLSGVASLAAGLLFGELWIRLGSKVAFLTAGGIAGLAAVLLPVLYPLARPPSSPSTRAPSASM